MHPFKLKISDAGRTEETEGENLKSRRCCSVYVAGRHRFPNKRDFKTNHVYALFLKAHSAIIKSDNIIILSIAVKKPLRSLASGESFKI